MNLVSLKNWSTEDIIAVVEGSIAIKNSPEQYANATKPAQSRHAFPENLNPNPLCRGSRYDPTGWPCSFSGLARY